MKRQSDELKKSQPYLNDQQRALRTIDNMVKQHIDFYNKAGTPITETEARRLVESIAYIAENKTKKVH